MTALQFAGFLACVAVAAAAQSVTGFAMALILLGLTGLFGLAPLPEVANVATVLSLAHAGIALHGPRRQVEGSVFRDTVLASFFGVAAGVALLAWLSANVVMVLQLLLGLVVVACAVIVLVRTEPLARRSTPASFRGFGFLSGLLGGLFAASGPPLVYQFYRQPMPLDRIRDTLVAALAAGSVMRLAMVVASGQFSLRALWMSAAAMPLAIAISWWLRRRPPPWDRAIVLKLVCVLLVITGIGLIAPALQALF